MGSTALAVDVRGLAKLVERRGKSFAVLELIQNAWDEDVTKVLVNLTYEGYGRARLVVEDDSPEGFRDLSHAYTLYADSYKKSDPEKRGRFNLGEKLVIALSDHVKIISTKGGIAIDVKNNKRNTLRTSRESGTLFVANLRMSKDEVEEALRISRTLIPPAHCETIINGDVLESRAPLQLFEAILPTEVADPEGYLRPTKRKTWVEVYEVREGEEASIYELGLPVVATGDTWHVLVRQKVPLNSDRDNVPPAFLRDLRALVVNEMAGDLTADSASANWVSEALEDDLIEKAAVEEVMTRRFGEKRVVHDPSDPEANRMAQSMGYTVIPGRALSSTAWSNVRRYEAVAPAGRIFPSPRPFHPEGEPLEMIEPAQYTPEQRLLVDGVEELHQRLIGRSIHVRLANDSGWGFNGVYGGGRLILNVATLRPRLDDAGTLRTVLHEFGHAYGSHLTHEFDDGIARVSAKFVLLLHNEPNYLSRFLPK